MIKTRLKRIILLALKSHKQQPRLAKAKATVQQSPPPQPRDCSSEFETGLKMTVIFNFYATF